MPLVSVVIPTHNRPEMLAEALGSVRAQSFTDYEIIVVSNGESAENQARSRAAALFHDAQWFALDKGNVSAARNVGVKRAKGEYIAFLDDDDIWVPEKLEWQISEIERTGAEMVAADCEEFRPDGWSVVHQQRVPDGLTYTQALSRQLWWTTPSAALVRRSVFKTFTFDRRLKAYEDTDLWRRLSWRHKIHQMDSVVVTYRRGHDNVTSNRPMLLFYEILFYCKMVWDTPTDLRDALPPQRITPCLLQLFHIGVAELRFRLRLRTRAKALVAFLIAR